MYVIYIWLIHNNLRNILVFMTRSPLDIILIMRSRLLSACSHARGHVGFVVCSIALRLILLLLLMMKLVTGLDNEIVVWGDHRGQPHSLDGDHLVTSATSEV